MSCRRPWAVALLAAGLAGCAAPRQAASAAEARHSFPNVLVYDQDGQPLHFYDDLIKGRNVLVYFMFTTCQGICPGTTANMVKVQDLLGEQFGREYFFVAVTLTPQIDTPQLLKAYAQDYGARPGWTFVTGDKADLEKLRRRFGLTDPDPVVDADVTQHAGVVVFGDESTGRWSALPGTMDAQEIVRTMLRRTRPMPQRAADALNPSGGHNRS